MNFDRLLAILGLLIGIAGLLLSARGWFGFVILVIGILILLYAIWLYIVCPPYKDIYIGFRYDFLDQMAEVVRVTRKTSFKVCGKNVTSVTPKTLTASGKLENFRSSLGKVARFEPAGGGFNLRIDFDEALPVGSVQMLALRFDAVACFALESESVAFYGVKGLTFGELEVNFCSERVPVSVRKVINTRGKKQIVEQCKLAKDFPSVCWQFRPKAGVDFLVEWDW